jgi:hypothetical protein
MNTLMQKASSRPNTLAILAIGGLMTAARRQIGDDSSARKLTIDDALNYKDGGD